MISYQFIPTILWKNVLAPEDGIPITGDPLSYTGFKIDSFTIFEPEFYLLKHTATRAWSQQFNNYKNFSQFIQDNKKSLATFRSCQTQHDQESLLSGINVFKSVERRSILFSSENNVDGCILQRANPIFSQVSQVLSSNFGDSRNLQLAAASIDNIITSPPYCTRIDYVVATLPESALKTSQYGL